MTIIEILNYNITIMSTWAMHNIMMINFAKTKYIAEGNRQFVIDKCLENKIKKLKTIFRERFCSLQY